MKRINKLFETVLRENMFEKEMPTYAEGDEKENFRKAIRKHPELEKFVNFKEPITPEVTAFVFGAGEALDGFPNAREY